jgi:hypothetical protein
VGHLLQGGLETGAVVLDVRVDRVDEQASLLMGDRGEVGFGSGDLLPDLLFALGSIAVGVRLAPFQCLAARNDD